MDFFRSSPSLHRLFRLHHPLLLVRLQLLAQTHQSRAAAISGRRKRRCWHPFRRPFLLLRLFRLSVRARSPPPPDDIHTRAVGRTRQRIPEVPLSGHLHPGGVGTDHQTQRGAHSGGSRRSDRGFKRNRISGSNRESGRIRVTKYPGVN